MPISRQFVSLMGGELSVNSTVGQGKPFREGKIFDVLRRQLGVRFVYEEPGDSEPTGEAVDTSALMYRSCRLNC